MTVITWKNIVEVDDVKEFVKVFKKEKEFKRKYGCSIDSWEYEESDTDIIVALLDDDKTGVFHVEFVLKDEVSGDGYYRIHILEPSLDYGRMS